MAATRAQLERVLAAAGDLLGARQDRTISTDEWADLAHTVAACTGATVVDLLTERDLAALDELRAAGAPA